MDSDIFLRDITHARATMKTHGGGREKKKDSRRWTTTTRTTRILLFVLPHLATRACLVAGDAASLGNAKKNIGENVGTRSSDVFWEKKTIARDVERFEEHCEPILGSHKDRWLELYETNARVLTIDASCSEHANGIGNYLGDFLAWFAWGMASERAVYVRFTDCGDEEHGQFVEERATDSKERKDLKRDFMKKKKEMEKMTAETNSQGEQVDELSKIKSSSRRSPSTMSPSRKLLQREASASLLKDDEESQRNQEDMFQRERKAREETPEDVKMRHEKEREALVKEEEALDQSMEGSALDGSGSASSEAELSQSQRNRIHSFERDRHELAVKRLKEMRRTGGPRPEVIQDLEDRERDLAGRTASMAGADLMMPPIDHRVVDDSEEKMELGASSIGAEDNGNNDNSDTLAEEVESEQAKIERENKLKQELADRAQALKEEEEDRALREMEQEGLNEDWSFLREENNHKSQCKEETKALTCQDRANMGLYFQLPNGKSWNLDARTRKEIFDSVGRGPKQVISPDDFSKSTNETFRMLENMLMNAHPWIEFKLHTSGQDHGLIPGSTQTCAIDGGGESSGAGTEFCADVGQAVIGLGYIRLAQKLGASLFEEPQEGTTEFFNSANYATYENKFAHQKIRGCLWHLTSRPTERLASVLIPYIDRFDKFDAIGGVHIRTGDWSDENTPSLLEQHDGRGTFEDKVASIDALLQNAGTSIGELKTGSAEKRFNAFNALIKKGGFTRTNKDPIVIKSCPKINGDYFTLGESNDAGLSPYFTCIGRAAQKAATDRATEGTGKFGIYVSTDSPYLKKLTSELTNLKDIVVGCIGTCEFHHADHNANEHLDPDPEFNDDVLSEDDDFDYNSEEDSSPIEPDLEGKEIYSKDPFIMSFVDAYILGLTDHNIQVTASTFDMVAQRGFGHGGVPQNLEDNGFSLQGAFKPWSNKHLPICEACGLTREDMDVEGSACQMTGEAIFGVSDDAKFAEMFKSSKKSEARASVKSGVNTEVGREEAKEEEEGEKLTPTTADFTSGKHARGETHSIKEQKEEEVSEEENKIEDMTASSDDDESVASEKQLTRGQSTRKSKSVEEKEAVVPSGGVVKNEVVPEDTLEALEEIREAQEEQATEEAEEVIESKAKEIIAERGEEQEHKEVIEQKQEESSAPERGVDDEERPSAEEEERTSRSSEKSRRKSSSLMNSTQTKSHSARETGGRTSGERRKGRPNPSVERGEGRTRTTKV